MRLSVGTKLQTGLNLGLYWRHPGPQILGLPRWGLVPHVSTFLGKTGSVGLEVLDTLGSSIMNLNANSGFILKKEILHSEGVQLLLSTDTKELLRIDKREELEVFSQEVVRFGDMCKDPQWHNLDRLFARLDLEMVTSTHLREEAEITTQDLTNLAQYMSVLMDFPQLTMTLPDRSKESVMKRTTLVANTSNLWLLVRLQYIQMQMLLVHGQAGSEATDSGSCQSCVVPKGSLVAVFGEVGSGKSSLLNSVLVHGSDLVLLDDILSAVDAQVASWIISNEILSPLLRLQLLLSAIDAQVASWIISNEIPSPLMNKKTRILCTHNIWVILCIFCSANSILTLVREFSFAYGGLCAANHVHNNLLKKLSSDLYTIDDSLPFILNITTLLSFHRSCWDCYNFVLCVGHVQLFKSDQWCQAFKVTMEEN
ncbi:PSK simulator 2-like protein isoform X2 [Tanacetum coccineum]